MDPESAPRADAPADAVPDPRDRRRSDRRRAEPSPGGEPRTDDRRRGDRRKEPVVPEQYRAGARHMNEYPLTPEELEFINAVNAYKQRYGRPFPTWSEVLHIVRALGYRKPEEEATPSSGTSG